ncbi:hypothetical protein BX600DRAFT_468747 [Xylariales sp. PMI_506]|nr:hypothetical protein BX600DRAFT_468747 [Xylariales sp. PMI_506]
MRFSTYALAAFYCISSVAALPTAALSSDDISYVSPQRTCIRPESPPSSSLLTQPPAPLFLFACLDTSLTILSPTPQCSRSCRRRSRRRWHPQGRGRDHEWRYRGRRGEHRRQRHRHRQGWGRCCRWHLRGGYCCC